MYKVIMSAFVWKAKYLASGPLMLEVWEFLSIFCFEGMNYMIFSPLACKANSEHLRWRIDSVEYFISCWFLFSIALSQHALGHTLVRSEVEEVGDAGGAGVGAGGGVVVRQEELINFGSHGRWVRVMFEQEFVITCGVDWITLSWVCEICVEWWQWWWYWWWWDWQWGEEGEWDWRGSVVSALVLATTHSTAHYHRVSLNINISLRHRSMARVSSLQSIVDVLRLGSEHSRLDGGDDRLLLELVSEASSEGWQVKREWDWSVGRDTGLEQRRRHHWSQAGDGVEDVVGSGGHTGQCGYVGAGGACQRTVSVGAGAGGGDLGQRRDDDVRIADGLRYELRVVIKLEIWKNEFNWLWFGEFLILCVDCWWTGLCTCKISVLWSRSEN